MQTFYLSKKRIVYNTLYSFKLIVEHFNMEISAYKLMTVFFKKKVLARLC
jgi:hypothetical protein